MASNIESTQIERIDGGAGEKLYDVRVGGKRVASVGTYRRDKVGSAIGRTTGTVQRWRVNFVDSQTGLLDIATRKDALIAVLVHLGYDHADAAAVAPRVSIF